MNLLIIYNKYYLIRKKKLIPIVELKSFNNIYFFYLHIKIKDILDKYSKKL